MCTLYVPVELGILLGVEFSFQNINFSFFQSPVTCFYFVLRSLHVFHTYLCTPSTTFHTHRNKIYPSISTLTTYYLRVLKHN